jgi:hypothetical protein
MSTDDVNPEPAQTFGISLTEEERARLSRVLFPQTDTTEVTLLGKTRELHPLPIKAAQRLKKALTPMNKELQAGIELTEKDPKAEYDAQDAILRSLEKTAEILAEFYGWTDIQEALSKDGISITELQALAVTQVEVNGSNDFLLDGLRTVVRWMRLAEMMSAHFQSTLTGLR